MKSHYPVTPDGRYFVVKGRLWRCTNPSIPAEARRRLVGELMQARRAKGEALRNDTSVPQDERRSKMMELRKDEETKVHAVLTDEQKAKYDAMQQERMRGRQNGGDGNAPAPASAPSM